MNCSCAFSPWVKELFASFGAAGGIVLLGLVLLAWGNKKVRREHYTATTPWGTVVKMNWPAFLLMTLGTLIILAALGASLIVGVLK